MQNKIIFATRILCISLVLFIASSTHAQDLMQPLFNYYTDMELYARGYKAYNENNFPEAALYLYAFGQRHKKTFYETNTKEEAFFLVALEYATRHLHAVSHVKADDPYGREYIPLDKSYFDKKPELPKKVPLGEGTKIGQMKDVPFNVGVTNQGQKPKPAEFKYLEDAWVVMYTVQLNKAHNAFEVTNMVFKNTRKTNHSMATFAVSPLTMVYFEAYLTIEDAKKYGNAKKLQKWTDPPFKNFGKDSTRLCKTNYFDIEKMLGNSSCYSNLSLSYPKMNTEQPSGSDDLPIAIFTADKSSCIPPCTVKFTNMSKNADRYVWSVNDEVVSREKDLSFTIKKVEGYRVKLTAHKGDKFDEFEIVIRGLGE